MGEHPPELGDDREPAELERRSAERLKFFTDAVVAIAMTLLILPLLESVSEAAHDGLSTADYLHEQSGQLFGFALSFVIIASFWASHHSLFEHVERYSGRLVWLNIAWMFTIVWLPVVTAMVGSMDEDGLQKLLYIGTLCVSSAIMVAINVVLRSSPDLWVPGYPPGLGDVAAALVLTVLFVVALVIALAVPGAGYYPMFVLFLTGPLQAVLSRRLTRRHAQQARG